MAMTTGIRRLPGRRSRGVSEDGFTLLEVVIALGVLAFGLLGVAAMQLYSLRQGQVGRHTSEATIVAHDHLEARMRDSFAGLVASGSWVAAGTVTQQVTTDSGTVSEQTYTVEERITNGTLNFTKTIDVRVTWSDPDDPNRQLVISTLRYDY